MLPGDEKDGAGRQKKMLPGDEGGGGGSPRHDFAKSLETISSICSELIATKVCSQISLTQGRKASQAALSENWAKRKYFNLIFNYNVSMITFHTKNWFKVARYDMTYTV